MSGREDAEHTRRRHQAAYSPRHQIPTIQKYREEKQNRLDQANTYDDVPEEDDDADLSRGQGARDSVRRYFSRDDRDGEDQDAQRDGDADADQDGGSERGEGGDAAEAEREEGPEDTSQMDPAQAANPRERRKGMKKRKEQRAERDVTDPVTHLPVRIHDFTQQALEEVSENDEPMGTTKRSATGLSNKQKSDDQLEQEKREDRSGQEAFDNLFPPPEFNDVRKEFTEIIKRGTAFGLVGSMIIGVSVVGLGTLLKPAKSVADLERTGWVIASSVWLVLGVTGIAGIWVVLYGVKDWMAKRIDSAWEDEVWEADRKRMERQVDKHQSESTLWLNSLLSSVWPLVNPDLFTSLADTLEDVMQASLPKLVRMVSVDDIGQGSESLRILGVRWLPTGAAARSVGEDGKLSKRGDRGHQNDRKVPGEGEADVQKDANGMDKEDSIGEDGEQQAQEAAQGMEAEEGDFINLEVAFAYRARSDDKTVKDRMKDMHLYMAFYLPGNIKLPVWVDLRGIVGTMRLRLQLAPDPPFFALCTITFMGQPKVDLSCIPLSRRGLNIMDVPLISNFVQSSVDAAMAEYVAPKSLTLDLKDMLAGDDFKKDTIARGVLVVNIFRGYDFKTGDAGIPMIKEGSSDPYVSVGWAKFGKPVWSTRLLMNEMEPVWNETCYLLVTPEELNVEERLRLQLWDSDRFSADDDLGRIEVDLKKVMKDDTTNGKMHKREDGFRALKAGENMPGKLEWSIGYFSKARIQPCQLASQSFDPEVRTMEQLEQKVDKICEKKLRETIIKEGRNQRDQDELKQQKAQELKSRQDAMMISAPPPEGYPSGIFSIQIHQITGLELETMSKSEADKKSNHDEEVEDGADSPSAYCNVLINHGKVFKTRTKPRNSKPFFNAGTERFIKDWRNTEVHISVRDARLHEDHPCLGIVHLPLAEVFKERSQVNGFWPLMGGVGYGRVRLSMVWRSVQLQAEPEALGWELGTLEVKPDVQAVGLPDNLKGLKLKMNTNLGMGKMEPGKDGVVEGWSTRKGKILRLAVQRRYRTCFTIRFRDKKVLRGNNAAFAVLWLKDIPDEEEREIELPVWKGDFQRAIACSLDECGERLGSIKLKLAFWSGLGGAHHKWASRDPDLRDVMQVLEISRDNDESAQASKEAGIVSGSETERSGHQAGGREDVDSSSEEEESDSEAEEEDAAAGGEKHGDSGGEEGNGILDKLSHRKKEARKEHRRHRGVMQWKIPRTVEWAAHKAGHAESKFADLFKHHQREKGIETEV